MGQVVSSLGSGSGCQAHVPVGLVPAIEHCLRTEPFCFIGGPCQEWDGVRWPCSEKVQAFWPDGYSWDLSSLPTNSHQWLETPQWFFSFVGPYFHCSFILSSIHPSIYLYSYSSYLHSYLGLKFPFTHPDNLTQAYFAIHLYILLPHSSISPFVYSSVMPI